MTEAVMNPTNVFTVGSVAARFGVRPWQIRRLFERGLLPPAQRLGAYRVVTEADIPNVEAALREAGYLQTEAAGA
jgi:DNA-binding transcriptional MerR regulator